MTGPSPRSGAGMQRVASLRAPGGTDSPSSVSLTGLAGLDAAQGSLTSNALFGSLNLEELLNSRDMEQQGRELLYSMRAAEASQQQQQHQQQHQNQPQQQQLRRGNAAPDGMQQQSNMLLPPQSAAAAGSEAAPSTAPPFAGFPLPEPQQPAARTADDIWKGLGMDAGGGAWPPAAQQQQQQQHSQHNPVAAGPSGGLHSSQGSLRSPTLAPNLGGYLAAGGGSAVARAAKLAALGTTGGLATNHSLTPSQSLAATHSLASSISSTGLTTGLGGLAMFGSGAASIGGSMEVASQLAAASTANGGGSGWWNAGLQQQQQQHPQLHQQLAPPTGLARAPTNGSSGVSSYGSLPAGGPGGGLRTASAGNVYPPLGSPRFSSHGQLPQAALFGGGGGDFGAADQLASRRGQLGTGSLPSGASMSQFGRDASLSPQRDDRSMHMPPPPNLVIRTAGGGSRPVDAAAAAAGGASGSPDILSTQPARRPRTSAATPRGTAGRSGRTQFPDIPAAATAVPRARGETSSGGSHRSSAEPQTSRERHKATKGRQLSVDEKEARELKRKEANRESAARSRDKRLKLIADLEVEVQQLKQQHHEFKAKIIEQTVPRPAALETLKDKALRRVRTDPSDCEAQIRQALLTEGLDLKALAVATAKQPTTIPSS